MYVIIERDDETKKIQASIKAGMSANASHLQSYLSTWDRYVFPIIIIIIISQNFSGVLSYIFCCLVTVRFGRYRKMPSSEDTRDLTHLSPPLMLIFTGLWQVS